MKRISQGLGALLARLELYELIGLVASVLAIIVFFAEGPRLDVLRGQPGYHWQPVRWVFSYYKSFLPEAVAGGIAGLAILHAIQRRPVREFPGAVATVCRMFAPFCILLAIYRTLQFFIPLFNHDRDGVLLRIDHWIFGTQPSLWLQPYIRPWLTDYMSFAYAAWFPLIFVTIVILYIRGRDRASEYIATLLNTFYIGYFCFCLVPAIGPQFTLAAQYHVALNGSLIQVIQKYNDSITIARDCFPSLHTGISVLMLVYVYRYARKWTWLYAPMVISIVASTIYLRQHYFIDVVAGIVLAAIMVMVGPKWVRSWNAYRSSRPWPGAVSIPVYSVPSESTTQV